MTFIEATTRAEALKKLNLAPDVITRKVRGGYMVFNTVAELKQWLSQK